MKILLTTFTLLLSSLATSYGVLNLSLNFNEDSLNFGTTGTFSLSGSATSSNTSLSRFLTNNSGAPANTLAAGRFALTVTGLSTTPSATYNGNPVDYSTWVGTDMIEMYPDGLNLFSFFGFDTQTVPNQLVQIGNGTTDSITGTFSISTSPTDAGTFSLSLLDGASIGTAADGVSRNVDITSAVVPEPSTYAIIAGLGIFGVTFWRRMRKA
ncbi:PEP-CTERM sorting domain-containing protein [Cerasicoccus fimbriatus]|uniref:PEP-CTERM sorting domain-containing protein n=1 Tax=Cerasicoccus fimbriatus TaxID=3014554 RepID=UPI0022B3DAB7|nr:PEP-CTERM sorting domain-containing protein [Cerasicoccus sp. TK19100]